METTNRAGALSADVHVPATFILELLDFICNELPRWRDRPDRAVETAETILTSQLCAHLNSAARHAAGWDILQFRVEEPDESHKNRKIDLVPAPCGATICIEGRSYTDFDYLFPIECKRLPIPATADRDEREYVISKHSSTGGIQRFKAGHHGSNYNMGAMIGYVQEGTITSWYSQIAGWIIDLVNAREPNWTVDDQLQLDSNDQKQRLAILNSSHTRKGSLPITLRHFWLEMN